MEEVEARTTMPPGFRIDPASHCEILRGDRNVDDVYAEQGGIPRPDPLPHVAIDPIQLPVRLAPAAVRVEPPARSLPSGPDAADDGQVAGSSSSSRATVTQGDPPLSFTPIHP